jgi:hypothetical protein
MHQEVRGANDQREFHFAFFMWHVHLNGPIRHNARVAWSARQT